MRRGTTPRADAGATATIARISSRAAELPATRKPRSAAGGWLRATAVTLAVTFMVLLAGSGSLLVYMSAGAQPGHMAHGSGHGTPGATPDASMAPTPWPTATGAPAHAPAQYRSIPRNVSLGCGKNGAPAPWPSAITSGAYRSAPNEVALTFDDGPTPYSTPAILSVLEQTGTPATMFVEGQYVSSWPDLLRREWGDGIAIGVHTWDHPVMTGISPSDQLWQLASTLDAIHNTLGAGTCVWFWRPPYGAYDAQVLQSAAELGLTTVTWNDDPQDWSLPGVDTIVSRVLSQVHSGSIILMHDGPSSRQETADALPAILAGLRARGLHPVTLPKLLADGQYPGVHPLSAPLAPAPPQPFPAFPASALDMWRE